MFRLPLVLFRRHTIGRFYCCKKESSTLEKNGKQQMDVSNKVVEPEKAAAKTMYIRTKELFKEAIKEEEQRKKEEEQRMNIAKNMFEEKNEDTRTDGRAWVGVDRAWVAVDTPNGRTWLAFDTEYRGRSGFFSYGSELNRGMRAKSGKNQHAFAPAFPVMKQQDLPASLSKETTIVLDKEQYNQPDFLEECADAKFFVIKSFNEDNIHKSIKYKMWTSTKKGNKKLDAAYQEAQQKPGRCPVFLFFSVNTSCQFMGVAEMIGPVNFNKRVKYWRQDKWNDGYFPLKWHIVKDVPNNLLRHVTLENNKNKPVTQSRDTQEVMLEAGLKLIKIFKEHKSNTCFLDDFGFYEARQKIILRKNAVFEYLFQEQEEKPTNEKEREEKPTDEKVEKNGEAQKSESESNLAEKDGDDPKVTENGSVSKIGDAPKGAKGGVSS